MSEKYSWPSSLPSNQRTRDTIEIIMAQAKNASLLSRPPEIRHRIYTYALYSSSPIELTRSHTLPPIASTNRQIRSETHTMWAAINTFQCDTLYFDGHLAHKFLRKYTRRIPALRHLRILHWSNWIEIAPNPELYDDVSIDLTLRENEYSIMAGKYPHPARTVDWARKNVQVRLALIEEADKMLQSVTRALGKKVLVRKELKVKCEKWECLGHDISDVQDGQDWSIVACVSDE